MILGFKEQFVEPIIQKIKVHTIREDKTNRWMSGRSIQFYIHVRTKFMKKFRPDYVCHAIQKIWIHPNKKEVYIESDTRIRPLSELEIKKLSLNDGFDSVAAFWEWFDEYFEGKIIHWTELRY